MNDIDLLLKSAAARPVTEPDIGAAVARGRWLRKRRWGGRGFIGLIVLLGLFMTSQSLIDRTTRGPIGPAEDSRHKSGGDDFVPAQNGEPTYRLFDFSIEYPYIEATKRQQKQRGQGSYCDFRKGACDPDPSKAEVKMSTAWATKDFPGEVRCRVEVFDDEGHLISSLIVGGLEDLTPRGRIAVPVPVSGRPERATGQCEAGELSPGPGYQLKFLRATEPEAPPGFAPAADMVELDFKVRRLVDDPGTKLCTLRVFIKDGNVERSTFTLGNPGKKVTLNSKATGDPNDIRNATVRCEEFTG